MSVVGRRIGRVLAAGVLGAVLVPGVASSAPAPGPATQSPTTQIPTEELLATIPVTSPEHDQTVSQLAATRQALVETAEVIDETTVRLDELVVAEATIDDGLPRLRRAVDRARAEEAEAAEELSALALAAYVGAPPEVRLTDLLTGDARATDRQRADALYEAVTGDVREALRDERRRLQRAEFAVATATTDLESVRASIAELSATRRLAEELRADAQAAVPRLEARIAELRPLSVIEGLGLPFATFASYLRAARATAAAQPDCGLEWPLLGAIARVESNHGTFGGARVLPDGRIDRPIIGIPLDGENNTAVVPDSDGGELDGDVEFDRAVGPFQFIPTTWATMATDGNGDGVADPHHLTDAARSAGRYLCRAGDLRDPVTLRSAILSYNRSEAYVDAVLGHLEQLAAFPVR